jgi:tetratricopeptide (TPR) repeat protein
MFTDPEEAKALGAQGRELLVRAVQTGDRMPLDEAVDALERCLRGTPEGDPDRPGWLSNLGLALWIRFSSAGNPLDLDAAIELGHAAVGGSPADHPARPGYLSNLGVALWTRFDTRGDMVDLHSAIEIHDAALWATPTDHPDRAGRLSNLGNALAKRSERNGSRADLERAIDLGEEAVASIPTEHPGHSKALANLGILLQTRFWYTGNSRDLDRAIELGEVALAEIRADSPDRTSNLTTLANSLWTRYKRTGSTADLDRAIELGEEAVIAHAGSDHPARHISFSNLANTLQDRFRHSGNTSDLNRAIALAEDAIAGSPEDHPNRAVYLNNLANGLRIRAEHSRTATDLDRAIEVGEEAVATTPVDHFDRAERLSSHGATLQIRAEHRGEAADLDRALAMFREASAETSASADVRARAAQRWARSAMAAQRWVDAVEGFEAAVALAALVVPRELDRPDQEFRLTEFADLGADSAAACLQAGQPRRAVELFEQGRAVLFSQLLDVRSDLTDLQRADPVLADQFAHSRDILDHPVPVAGAPTGSAADPRREAAAAFERILCEIRSLPGFERFLAPRLVEELLPAAIDGPVVLINISRWRCDAMILTSDVAVVPLPGVDSNVVGVQVADFLRALAEVHEPSTRVDAEERIAAVLRWLADRITGPALDHLGLNGTQSDSGWPRVWWCPGGVLSLLPLAAAGDHDPSSQRCDAVIDRVISSTIPTLRALIHARQPLPHRRDAKILAVAMPHTADHDDLPGVTREVSSLADCWPTAVTVLGLPGTAAATHDTVTAQLPEYPLVHFACHGETDFTNPSESHLLLTDRPLTVRDLTRMRLSEVDLAFLSACATARTGVTLPDEPIHLAAACQLVGYRHVIASLWPISDADTAWLAKTFYTAITNNTVDEAATALHRATRRLRLLNRLSPSRWAPYTHTGP